MPQSRTNESVSIKQPARGRSNFRLKLAGTGATWKDGKEKGLPLYGYGAYFAECVTKARGPRGKHAEDG